MRPARFSATIPWTPFRGRCGTTTATIAGRTGGPQYADGVTRTQIQLTPSTWHEVAASCGVSQGDVVIPLMKRGFERFLVINGLGGNAVAVAASVPFGTRWPDLELVRSRFGADRFRSQHLQSITSTCGMAGAKYVTGLLTVGVAVETGVSQGNVNLTGISLQRGQALDVGIGYNLASGLVVYAEYQYQLVRQSMFNSVTSSIGSTANNTAKCRVC
jgi:hypothetical protein